MLIKRSQETNKIVKKGIQYKMRAKAFYVIMIPYLIMMLCVKGFPFAWGLYISLTNFTGFNIDKLKMVGINNYLRVFTDNEAISSIGRTFGISLIVVPLSICICLLLSLLLYANIKGIGVFRTIYYLPSIIPSIAVVTMWKGMFVKEGGLLNMVSKLFGGQSINWLGYDYARKALIIMLLWGAGSGILTNLAAMKAVPNDLYEAAEIEGAGYFTKLFKITLPLISNMIYMNLVTGIIAMLQLFGQPVLLTATAGAGLTALPIRPIYTYLVHVYQQIFVNLRFGYGLAMVWVIFTVIMLLTIVVDKTSKYWVNNEMN